MLKKYDQCLKNLSYWKSFISMDITEELKKTLRKNVIETLQLLSEPALQKKYESDVPIAYVPAELFCLWYDDSYLPESDAFIEAFSEYELKVLANFTEVFDVVYEETDENPPDLEVLHSLPSFQIMMTAARKALRELEQ